MDVDCRTDFDCPTRHDCFQGECICNYELIYYGKHCEHTSPYIVSGYTIILALILVVISLSSRVFYMKWGTSSKRFNAATTTHIFVTASLVAFMMFCIANLCRGLNTGPQEFFVHRVVPISFSISSVCLVSALLNICFLWIELSCSSDSLGSQSNIQKSKNALIFCGTFFFTLILMIYFRTSKYTWVSIVLVLYMLFIGIAFVKGSWMLTKKLQSTSLAVPVNVSSKGDEHMKTSCHQAQVRTGQMLQPEKLEVESVRTVKAIKETLSTEGNSLERCLVAVVDSTNVETCNPVTHMYIEQMIGQTKRHPLPQEVERKVEAENEAYSTESTILPQKEQTALCLSKLQSESGSSTHPLSSSGPSQPKHFWNSYKNRSQMRDDINCQGRQSVTHTTTSWMRNSQPQIRTYLTQSSYYEAKRIEACSKSIAYLNAFFCCTSICYYFLSKNPKYKYYLFLCQFLSMVDIVVIHLRIIKFLAGRIALVPCPDQKDKRRKIFVYNKD